MPNLRLTEQEALDITAYLMTLKDDTPAAERVAARSRTRGAPPGADDLSFSADATRGRRGQAEGDERARAGCVSRREDDRSLRLLRLPPDPGLRDHAGDRGRALGGRSKHADLLYFGYVPIEHNSPAWFFQKLKEPRSFDRGKVAEFNERLRMPQFDFTDEDAAAITTVLQGLTKEKMPLESMRRLSPAMSPSRRDAS